MSVETVDIERVVREVLAELFAAQTTAASSLAASTSTACAAGASVPAKPAEEQPEQCPSAVRAPGELVVDARVVTLEQVAGRLPTVRRLLVSRKAVVTPAVQDELLRRNIELVRSDALNAPVAAAPRLVVMCSGADFDPAGLIAVITREGVSVEPAESDCLIAATERLAAELAVANTLGLLLTRHTAAGLCLANRLAGVRAVTGCEAPAVATAAAAVGANLLVLNPRAGSFFQLKQMATEFCRGGVRPCPEVFCRQLG